MFLFLSHVVVIVVVDVWLPALLLLFVRVALVKSHYFLRPLKVFV